MYKLWVDLLQIEKHYGFLWIKGKPGTGKSISMKYLYQNAVRAKGRLVLKFFFNARGNKLEYSTDGMYRSLLWQLLKASPASRVDSPALDQLCALSSSTLWLIEALKETFGAILLCTPRWAIYCFVDALDECAEDEIRDMIALFENLGEDIACGRLKLHVCFSSQHYLHVSINYGLQLVLEDEIDYSNDI